MDFYESISKQLAPNFKDQLLETREASFLNSRGLLYRAAHGEM